MSVFWLRVASALYVVGLFYAIQIVVHRGRTLFPVALGTFIVGAVLHMVALVEASFAVDRFPPAGWYNAVSLCAFLLAILFLFMYWRYRFESLAVFLFPLVFGMAAVSSTQSPVGTWTDPTTRTTWLVIHILLVLLGSAAFVITALAAAAYLVQERQLKRKKPVTLLERLPPLGTLDNIITRSMGFGFALLTIGTALGAGWAFVESGQRWLDGKVLAALLTWGFCLLMVTLRFTAGWRGRRAAYLAVTVLVSSAATWAMHYVSP